MFLTRIVMFRWRSKLMAADRLMMLYMGCVVGLYWLVIFRLRLKLMAAGGLVSFRWRSRLVVAGAG